MNQKKLDSENLSETEKHIIKNHNNNESHEVIMKIVNTILLPLAMSTYQGQYGASAAFGMFQEIVRKSLNGKSLRISNSDLESHEKYFNRLKEDQIISWKEINSSLNPSGIPDSYNISLTREAKRIVNILKVHPYELDDYHISSVLWCLSRANEADDREREVRFGYTRTILYTAVQAMAEIEEGSVVWSNPKRPSEEEFKKWVKTTGAYDSRGRSDMLFGNAADYLGRTELQSMLSFSGLLSFEKDKVNFEPTYTTLKKLYSHQSLKSIATTLDSLEIVTSKVDEAIKSEKVASSETEFAP